METETEIEDETEGLALDPVELPHLHPKSLGIQEIG